jgi:hypothetical protein
MMIFWLPAIIFGLRMRLCRFCLPYDPRSACYLRQADDSPSLAPAMASVVRPRWIRDRAASHSAGIPAGTLNVVSALNMGRQF